MWRRRPRLRLSSAPTIDIVIFNDVYFQLELAYEDADMRPSTSWIAVVVVLTAATFGDAQKQQYTDDDLVRYAKAIDVSKLDPSLPSQPLEQWLLGGPAKIDELYWHVERSCDLKFPEPDGDGEYPLCVKMGFRRGNTTGFGLVRVGTLESGVKGVPTLQYLDVLKPFSVGGYEKLSEFPRYLDGIPQFGTLCVLPIAAEWKERVRLQEHYKPATLRLRIDKQPAQSWPLQRQIRIEPLSLNWKDHVVSVSSGSKQIQSLKFRFVDFQNSKLCLAFDSSQLPRIGADGRDSWCSCQ